MCCSIHAKTSVNQAIYNIILLRIQPLVVELQVNSERMHTQESRGNQQPDTCRKDEFKFGNPIGERNISRVLQDKKSRKNDSTTFHSGMSIRRYYRKGYANRTGTNIGFQKPENELGRLSCSHASISIHVNKEDSTRSTNRTKSIRAIIFRYIRSGTGRRQYITGI